MTRDHQIRIAVSHLKGEERSREIDRLLQNPHLIKTARARMTRAQLHRGRLNIGIRLTGPQYLKLHALIEESGLSQAAFIKRRLGL